MTSRKLGFALLGVAAALLIAAPTVYAAANSDTGDHFSLKAGTTIVAREQNPTHPPFTLTYVPDGRVVTITCTTFTFTGTIPASGLTIQPKRQEGPTISGCKDSMGGTDTISGPNVNGPWDLTEIDAAKETATEPNTGDGMSLTVPKGGATVTSTALKGCTVTLAPKVASSIIGVYNDNNQDVVKKALIPVSSKGCTTSGSATVAVTLVLSTSVHDT
jgi:hypothetical protein